MLAPMAGISDLPFRQAVQRFGVGMTVAEMVSSKPELQHSRKHHQRRISLDEPLPRAIQIVGNDAQEMANAAALNEARGAGLIDINMGCPAKKVCSKAAGSALLGDERKVRAILRAVVAAVKVPVTLKIRTGLTLSENNAVEIARIAEGEGIQNLIVHGRSRACLFKGEAEYATIRRVKRAVSISVVANGDICSAAEAAQVLAQTGADGVMLGRAVQGQPWLPKMVGDYLLSGGSKPVCPPTINAQKRACLDHIRTLYVYYGDPMGVKIARKHIRWYLANFEGGQVLSQTINRSKQAAEVLDMLEQFYARKAQLIVCSTASKALTTRQKKCLQH